MSAVADRLYRRVMMMVGTMKITATDDGGPVHKVQVKGFPPEQIDNMPVLQIHGIASHAPPGSDAMAIFTSGDRSNGVIVATGSQQHRPRGAPVGGTIIYDTAGTTIALDAAGTITITCKTLNINASTAINLTSPHVTVKSPRFESSA